MNSATIKLCVIVAGLVCGTALVIAGQPGAWFPWTVAAIVLFFA